MTRNVGIYIYDDVEVLDLGGPFEVFATASRMKARRSPGNGKAFDVFTIAATNGPVNARAGLRITASFDLTNHPKIDVLVVPGGVHNTELERADVIAWIARTARETEITASVCTGAFLLAKAGLLQANALSRIGKTSPTSARGSRTSPCRKVSAGSMPAGLLRLQEFPPRST